MRDTVQHPLRGIALCAAAVVLFACLDATAKHLSRIWPVAFLAWGRYTAHLLLMTIFLGPSWRGRLLRTKRPWAQIIRGSMLVAVTVLMMAAFKRMPLAEATSIIFAAPLLVVLAARPVLKEKIGPLRWVAVVMGFVGVLMLTRPGNDLDPVGMGCALAAAVAYAIYQLMTRMMSNTEHPVTMLYYTALTGTLSLSCTLPTLVTPRTPNTIEVLAILALGILGGGGHFLLTRAFRDAPASLLAPLVYTQLPWAALLGWLVFDNLPGPLAATGMLVICAAGVLIAVDGTRAARAIKQAA